MTKVLRITAAAAAFFAAFGVAPQAMAQASQSWTQVGSLVCKVNPNIGFIIFGHQPMECRVVAQAALAMRAQSPPSARERSLA